MPVRGPEFWESYSLPAQKESPEKRRDQFSYPCGATLQLEAIAAVRGRGP
jgi:hypothetical protein